MEKRYKKQIHLLTQKMMLNKNKKYFANLEQQPNPIVPILSFLVASASLQI